MNFYNKLSDVQKKWIASSIQTFISSFFTIIGLTLQSGSIQWTSAFWIGLILTSVRAAFKAIFEKSSIPLLGGIK